jgi:hypothetical protein
MIFCLDSSLDADILKEIKMSLSIDEAVRFFAKRNIPEDAYSFYKDKEDAICVDKVGEEWLVYYVERGQRRDLAWGKNEGQAINVLKLFLLEQYKLI